MQKHWSALTFLGAAIALSACVPHLSRSQCLSMEWYQVGYNDALQDRNQRDLSKAIQDCSRYKIAVNVVKYKQGWLAGAREFCIPSKAFALGEKNQSYTDICPANQKRSFIKAWREGLKKFWSSAGYNDGLAGRIKQNLDSAVAQAPEFKSELISIYSREWHKGVRKYCVPGRAYQLGVNGRNYNPICPPDLSRQFALAWHRGLKKYCVPSTGYNLGRNGDPFPQFCAADQLPAFRNAYDEGNRIFRDIQAIENQIAQITADIATDSRTILSKQRVIDRSSDDLATMTTRKGRVLTPKHRQELRAKIRRKRNEIDELHDRIRHNRAQIERLQIQLNELKAR